MRTSLFVAALLFTMTAPEVRAESDAVCQGYANDAVAAFTEAQSRHCPLANARWQGNRDAHYNWCRSAPSAWVVAERNARNNQLRVCRGEPVAVQCDRYAIEASSAQRSNQNNRCGFTGPRWQDNYDNHLGWCLGVPADTAFHEANIRQAMISVCVGAEPYRRCDAYARTAAAQVKEAKERNCGFTGARWTPAYEDHLLWCVSQPPEAAASEERQRAGPLSQCRTWNIPVAEACNWTATARVAACQDASGAPSDSRQSQTNTACGPTQETAQSRSVLGLKQLGCLVEGTTPSPGCCTYTQESEAGCGCSR